MLFKPIALFVFNNSENKMLKSVLSNNPGLYKNINAVAVNNADLII